MTFGTTTRLMHWGMAILVLAMFAAGMVMTRVDDRAIQDPLFIFHKSCGALLLALIAVRILWRMTHPAPPLPATVPSIQRFAAHAVHLGLYLFLIVMTVSGYVRVTAGGFPIDLLDAVGIPSALGRDEAVAEVAKRIHAVSKYGLGLLILLHVGAAAFHGLVLRDGVFSRMWPPVRPAAR